MGLHGVLLVCVALVLGGSSHVSAFQSLTRKLAPTHFPTRFAATKSEQISPTEAEAEAAAIATDKKDLPNQSSNTAENAAILLVYFVQGALGLAGLARSFFLKDQLGLDPAASAAILGTATLPWTFKPLYGFLSDSVPLFGYRKRSYLILSGLVGSASWLAMSSLVHDAQTALLYTLSGSGAIAVADVVIDSIVVERTREAAESILCEEGSSADDEQCEVALEGKTSAAGDLQSLCWGASAVGSTVSAYFSGSLLEKYTPENIFAITAVFPMIIAVASLGVREQRIDQDGIDASNGVNVNLLDTFKDQAFKLKETITTPNIYLPVLFVFLWRATPSADSASFYFSVNDLGFKPEFLGKVNVVASLASLFGVIMYRLKLKEFPVKDLIFWTTLISVPLSLTQLLLVTHKNLEIGIPNEFFFLVDNTVLVVLGQIAFMPTLALAASLCPPGIEGTLFASLMSIYNAGGLVSQEAGALVTQWFGVTDSEFGNLPQLITFCSLSSLVTLPFIGVLGDVDGSGNEEYDEGLMENRNPRDS